MKAFLAMGGYAQFVWPSFALTFGIVIWNVLAARRSFRQARLEAQRRLAVLKENG